MPLCKDQRYISHFLNIDAFSSISIKIRKEAFRSYVHSVYLCTYSVFRVQLNCSSGLARKTELFPVQYGLIGYFRLTKNLGS